MSSPEFKSLPNSSFSFSKQHTQSPSLSQNNHFSVNPQNQSLPPFSLIHLIWFKNVIEWMTFPHSSSITHHIPSFLSLMVSESSQVFWCCVSWVGRDETNSFHPHCKLICVLWLSLWLKMKWMNLNVSSQTSSMSCDVLPHTLQKHTEWKGRWNEKWRKWDDWWIEGCVCEDSKHTHAHHHSINSLQTQS